MRQFYLLLLALCAGSSYAQTQIAIGSSSSPTDNAPLQRSNGYSASEAIYRSAEINANGTITAIEYYRSTGTAVSTFDSIYVYLKKSTDTAVAVYGNTAGYTLVYAGPYAIGTSSGYKAITLTSPFAYNTNEGNLSVLVVRPYATPIATTGATGRPQFRYSNQPAGAPDSLGAFYSGNNPYSDTTAKVSTNWRPNIRITMTLSCPAPTSATATNVTPFAADLNWNYSGSPMTFEVKYGPQGFNVNTAGSSVYTATKPYTLSPPLTPSSSYSYYVRAICAAGDTSAWSAVANFATPATCVAPTAPASTGITKNSATLNWSNMDSPVNFEIKYGMQGFNVNTTGTSVFTATKPYTLNPPLTPSTNYSYYVRSICTPGDTSAWSPVSNFTTLCDYPSMLSATNDTACGGSTATL